jgi:hypothetical protein
MLRQADALSHGNRNGNGIVSRLIPVSAVVYLAIGAVPLLDAGNIHVEAKIGVSSYLEDIDIQDGSVNVEPMRSSIELGNIICRKGDFLCVRDPILSRGVDGRCRSRESAKIERKSVVHWKRLDTQIPSWDDAASRGLAEHPVGWSNGYFQRTIYDLNICDACTANMKIGAELPNFCVLHDSELIPTDLNLVLAGADLQGRGDEESAGDHRINCNSNYRGNFNSKLPSFAAGIFFIIFVVLFGKGYERLIYGGRFLCGATMMCFWAG